ncbi:hypothetical protein [Paraburkholderia nemoris]|uniref:hypothetical protein n=1 Tax=Paraburkholderia nemoris TaxID=2793076 RepID=UPI001B8CD972|nr:hypothetical protein [Paraburkholderia nemoris]
MIVDFFFDIRSNSGVSGIAPISGPYVAAIAVERKKDFMGPYREFGNILFARINYGWFGYVIFSAMCLFLLLGSLEPLLTTAIGGGFRSVSPPPPMTPYHWIGTGLAACFYFVGAAYAGCIERRGELFIDRARILATLNFASATRGVGLFLFPLVAMIGTTVGLFACGVHGKALPIVPICAMLSNWLCFRVVAWLLFRP